MIHLRISLSMKLLNFKPSDNRRMAFESYILFRAHEFGLSAYLFSQLSLWSEDSFTFSYNSPFSKLSLKD